jgi:ABC-type branched-subunit amino acid transport system substrate-binding protein
MFMKERSFWMVHKTLGLARENLMKSVHKLIGLVLALSLALSVAACTAADSPESTLGEDIYPTGNSSVLKIAFLCDMTGMFSKYGELMDAMGKAVIENINEEGIKGFSRIEVKTYDTQSNQTVACEQIYKAKYEDDMDVVWGSWVEAEIIPYVDKLAAIPFVMNNPTGLKAFDENVKWSINPCATAWDIGLATGEFFKLNNVRTWAIAGQGWEEGWLDTWSEGIKYILRDTDIECAFDQEVPSDLVDWSEYIEKWKRLNIDALVIPNPGEGIYTVIKQMKDAGFQPDFIIVDPVAGGDYYVMEKVLGKEYMIGLIAPTNNDVEAPVWKEFATKHLEEDYMPYGFSGEIWDTLHLIKLAAEIVGPEGVNEPETFLKALKSSSYNGSMGYTLGPFRENGLLEDVTVSFVQCVDGPPDWTNKVDYHWKTIFTLEVRNQLALNEAIRVWPQLGERLGQ